LNFALSAEKYRTQDVKSSLRLAENVKVLIIVTAVLWPQKRLTFYLLSKRLVQLSKSLSRMDSVCGQAQIQSHYTTYCFLKQYKVYLYAVLVHSDS
jgi:hypothetical protein